mgnify:FL=1
MKTLDINKDDWCIQITRENIKIVKKYILSKYPDSERWNWSIEAYYGIKYRKYDAHYNRVWDTLISFEEFLQLTQSINNYYFY